MDPTDIIKAAPELAKGAGALAAAVPFTAVVKRMLGPAADELAEMWRDQVRVYRYERQVKLLEKVEKIAKRAGFEPQPVPPKLLFPLLEGASFEDEESIHDMWANLLANAASPENTGKVRPGFVAILKQMAPDEALLLRTVAGITADYYSEPPVKSGSEVYTDLDLLMERLETAFNVFVGRDESASRLPLQACLLALESDRLIGMEKDIPLLTARGIVFLEACRPPKPKA